MIWGCWDAEYGDGKIYKRHQKRRYYANKLAIASVSTIQLTLVIWNAVILITIRPVVRVTGADAKEDKMTKKEFMEHCWNSEFEGYFIVEVELDEIADKLGMTDEDGNYVADKISAHFDCELIYCSNPNAQWPDVKLIFD